MVHPMRISEALFCQYIKIYAEPGSWQLSRDWNYFLLFGNAPVTYTGCPERAHPESTLTCAASERLPMFFVNPYNKLINKYSKPGGNIFNNHGKIIIAEQRRDSDEQAHNSCCKR